MQLCNLSKVVHSEVLDPRFFSEMANYHLPEILICSRSHSSNNTPTLPSISKNTNVYDIQRRASRMTIGNEKTCFFVI